MAPTLTIAAVGGSVVVSPDKEAYVLGEKVNLEAVADPGYEFSGWSGGLVSQENPTVIVMHANRSITASFIAAAKTPNPKGDKSGY
jgi:hypothetical protein